MRLPDAGLVRDAIPFAMIPYLPAKTQASRTVEIEEEEAARLFRARQRG